MHSYESLRLSHGSKVSQTIDSPIMIFDFWELSEAFLALAVILVFGVVFYSWGLMLVLLSMVVFVVPVIRSRNKRGIFLHWPYQHLHVSLPGLFNPRGKRKFSD